MVDASARLRKVTTPNDRPPGDSTRRFYELHAAKYAEATRGRPLHGWLERFSEQIPAGVVLDLGCGAGYDLTSLEELGHATVGLDYSEPLAAIARAKSRGAVVVADMRTLPFRTSSFDGVWASASLLHVPRADLPLALAEIRRVLKPEGLLFASVKAGGGSRRNEDGRCFTFYERLDWAEALSASGFRALDIAYNAGSSKDANRSPEKWMTSLARTS